MSFKSLHKRAEGAIDRAIDLVGAAEAQLDDAARNNDEAKGVHEYAIEHHTSKLAEATKRSRRIEKFKDSLSRV
jgi:hypothetical protein